MTTQRKAFNVIRAYSSSVKVTSIETGTTWEVYFEGKFKANDGDVISILIENNDKWKVIVNEMNGDTAVITRKV